MPFFPSMPADATTKHVFTAYPEIYSHWVRVSEAILDLATAPIDSKLRPILAFVKKLTLTSTRMTQADADAVFAVGWDEAALHSAIAVCCLFNFMNRLVDGHGIEADRASFAERGRKHVEMGYVAQYEAAVAKNIR